MKKQELFNNVTEGFPYQRQPQQMGLYDAAYEHDACGVGMLVNIHGEKSHDIVESALKVLENMRHRGAEGADNKTGDGAGIMLQIPHEFILLQGIPVPEKGRYGTGLLFLPKNEKDQAAILSIIIEEIEKEEMEGFSHPKIEEVRVMGGCLCIELKDGKDIEGFQEFAYERGVFARPFLKYIYSMVPYVIKEDELRKVMRTMKEWFENK